MVGIFLALVVLMVLLVNLFVILRTRDRVVDEFRELPQKDVALVLGAAPRSEFFAFRLDAAAELYHAGVVRHLLVSGDNRGRYYNEPMRMKQGLLRRGVPEAAITCDYAGLRTLDSVVRAGEIFGQNRMHIVTQRFHAYRALLIAQNLGLDAHAYCAPDASPSNIRTYTEWREVFARILAFADLYLWSRQPRHLGPQEPILLPSGDDLTTPSASFFQFPLSPVG